MIFALRPEYIREPLQGGIVPPPQGRILPLWEIYDLRVTSQDAKPKFRFTMLRCTRLVILPWLGPHYSALGAGDRYLNILVSAVMRRSCGSDGSAPVISLPLE